MSGGGHGAPGRYVNSADRHRLPDRGDNGGVRAKVIRIDAVAEGAADRLDFKVAPAGLKSELGNQIRHRVGGGVSVDGIGAADGIRIAAVGRDGVDRVRQALDIAKGKAAHAGGSASSGRNRIRVLDREAGPGLGGDLLDHADGAFTRVREARRVGVVDQRGQPFAEGINSLAGGLQERPVLAAGD